jgi:DNA-binding protein
MLQRVFSCVKKLVCNGLRALIKIFDLILEEILIKKRGKSVCRDIVTDTMRSAVSMLYINEYFDNSTRDAVSTE